MLLGGGSYDVNFLPLGGAIETLRGVIKSFDFVILESRKGSYIVLILIL